MKRRDWPKNANGLPAATVWNGKSMLEIVGIVHKARALRLPVSGPRRDRYGTYIVSVECSPDQADAISPHPDVAKRIRSGMYEYRGKVIERNVGIPSGVFGSWYYDSSEFYSLREAKADIDLRIREKRAIVR